MDARVQLVFLGEVLAGHRLDDVKRELGRLLKLDEARLAALFSGARAVLKRSLTHQEAARYVDHLTRLGARIHVEPMPMPGGAWPVLVDPETRETTAAAKPAAAAPASSVPPSPAPPTPVPPTLSLVPLETPGEDEIVCPKCGERQSKRILCRSCATDMPMGIAAKIEAEEQAKQQRLDELRARRGLRPADERAGSDGRADSTKLWQFSFDGRIGRLPYATANTLLVTALFLLTVFLMQRPGLGRLLFVVVGVLFVLFQSMRLAVLRCHDCDRHGWWSLFVLVPYAGTVASLLLSFLPGNAHENEYGEPPHRGRWRSLLLALLGLVVAVGLTFRTLAAFIGQQMRPEQHVEATEQVDELAQAFHSARAARVFREEYDLAPNHRAFAISSTGAWGWKSGASSVEDAMRIAVENCDAEREAYTPPCRLVNVDGQWAPRTR